MTLLDSAPLVAAIDHAARKVGWERRTDGGEYRVSPARWAERQGICAARQYCRWKAGQHVTIHTADRVAIALGHHPAELWGDAWWTLDEGEAA